ncbi:MAG: hypothetical protein WCG63_07755 [Opitutaceae bacterium]
MGIFLNFGRWLLGKTAAASLILALGLGTGGLWLFLRDNVNFEDWRRDVIRTINGERAHIQSALGDVEQRLELMKVEMAAERSKVEQAGKIIQQLKGLESTWDRLVGNVEQQRANAEQRTKMIALRAAAIARAETLQKDFMRMTWERDGLEVALGKKTAELKLAESKKSKVQHYLEDAWARSRNWVYLALGLYFFGPTLGKLVLYFGLAPLIAGGRAVRLRPELADLPEVAMSRVSAEIALQPGERLWVKSPFLQASDEGVERATKFLLDWRIPFTCLASGLIELLEIKAPPGSGEQRVTLSNQANAQSELAVLTLSPGAAIVLRPSFLAGVVVPEGAKLEMRRRWQIWRWQAWVTLQFRFFEFSGPCRLIVVGSRGVRAERLAERNGDAIPARRANQDATVGFTPNLDYRPVRAETFWSYYRGVNPLFDDLFAGHGIFLCQEISAQGDASRARHFWGGLWGAVMKIFGL